MSDPSLYMSLVGALKYLTWTRPDISFVVQQVCQYIQHPTEAHFTIVKRILRYIKGTIHQGIWYTPGSLSINVYSDSDWAGSITDRKSTRGYIIYLGMNPISWQAKKQPTVSRFSTESEYKSLAHTST